MDQHFALRRMQQRPLTHGLLESALPHRRDNADDGSARRLRCERPRPTAKTEGLLETDLPKSAVDLRWAHAACHELPKSLTRSREKPVRHAFERHRSEEHTS